MFEQITSQASNLGNLNLQIPVGSACADAHCTHKCRCRRRTCRRKVCRDYFPNHRQFGVRRRRPDADVAPERGEVR